MNKKPRKPMDDFSDGLRLITAMQQFKDASDAPDHQTSTVSMPARHWSIVRAVIMHAEAADDVLSRLDVELSSRFGRYDEAPQHMGQELRPLIETARRILAGKYEQQDDGSIVRDDAAEQRLNARETQRRTSAAFPPPEDG